MSGVCFSGGALRGVAAVALVAFAATTAAAEERGVIRARLELDKVERGLGRKAEIDVRAANKLIGQVNKAKGYLKGCKDTKAADWVKQAERANALDKAVRARIKGADSEAGGDGEAPKEPDATTLKAKALVDEVEEALEALKPGDIAEANRLIKMLNASRTWLGKSSRTMRTHEVWRTTRQRAAELDKAVRAKASAKPAPAGKSGSGESDTGNSGSGTSGPGAAGASAASADHGAGPCPADKPAMSPRDRVNWRRLSVGRKGFYESLAAQDPRLYASAAKLKAQQGMVEQQRAKLKGFENPSHPMVVWGLKVLEAYDALLIERHKEGVKRVADAKAAAAKEAAEVDGELKEIEEFFDAKTFTCELQPPFPPKRVKDWLARLEQYRQITPRGLAMVENFVKERPRYAKHPRVRKLTYIFEKVLPRKLAEGYAKTAGRHKTGAGIAPGHMLDRIEMAERLVKYTTPGLKDSNLADDKWVKRSLETLDEGIEAAEARNIVLETRKGKRDPALIGLMVKMVQLRRKLGESAKRLLAETRMPAAKSTSGALLKIAETTVKRAKYGADTWKRVVINSDKRSKEERFREARVEGQYLKIWKWTERWDEFQVCAAEPVEGELRLVYYTLKYLHVGPSWKTVKKWYVSGRIVSRRILPENVDK